MKKAPVKFDPPPDPKGCYVGTSGWAYDIWKPEFFPADLPKAKFLPYYASKLTACEVNYTFRSRLSAKTAEKWVAETPPSFRFVCKANQFLTHIKRLKNCDESVEIFADGMTPLQMGKRFGPALFQLPENFKADPVLLREFLMLLPKWMRAAFEFRNDSWFTDATYRALSDSKAALCIAETEQLVTPEIQTTDFVYYRFRKSDYSADDRKKLAERVIAARAKSDAVYAFFKHEERPESPLFAVELLNRVLT